MQVIIWIAVAVIEPDMVIEMIMTAKIHPPVLRQDIVDKDIPLILKKRNGIRMINCKCSSVPENEDMRLFIGGELLFEPIQVVSIRLDILV